MNSDDFISKEELSIIVCENIKKFRKQAKLTQQELSEKIDMSHEYMRQLESPKGKKQFTFHTLYKISKVLNVPLDSFVIKHDE